MSSKVTGDAQPDTGPEVGNDHTLPTGIVENSAGAGAGAVAVAEKSEPTAEPASASKPEPASEPVAESAQDETDEPTEVAAGAEPAASADSAELADSAEPAEPAEPASEPEPPAAKADTEEAAEATGEKPENRADLEELLEPTELIAMAELLELAEPVEDHVRRRRGRGVLGTVLIAFVFVLLAGAIVGGAFAIVGSLTHGFKKPVIIHYKKSAIFSLKTGQCIDPNGQTASIVSCSTPHDAEVFATFSLSGSKWPGATAVRAAASSGCSTRLTGYLNPQLAINLSSTYIYPDSVAWQAGTRTVICEVRATSGQLTGSVRGASATAG